MSMLISVTEHDEKQLSNKYDTIQFKKTRGQLKAGRSKNIIVTKI